jgi:hypothetical protein
MLNCIKFKLFVKLSTKIDAIMQAAVWTMKNKTGSALESSAETLAVI